MRHRLSYSLALVLMALTSVLVGAQDKAVTASAGWIVAPAAGAVTASAYLEIQNPTMYDVYIVSASADAAGAVELRESSAPGESKVAKELTVPAFGTMELKPDGPHLVLKGLTRALKKGETVGLTLQTDGGITLKVPAVIR